MRIAALGLAALLLGLAALALALIYASAPLTEVRATARALGAVCAGMALIIAWWVYTKTSHTAVRSVSGLAAAVATAELAFRTASSSVRTFCSRTYRPSRRGKFPYERGCVTPNP